MSKSRSKHVDGLPNDWDIVCTIDSGTGWQIQVHRHQLPMRLGRNSACELGIPDIAVSRVHCVIDMIEDRVYVRDLGSVYGTGIGEILLKDNKSYHIQERTCLLFGETLVWIQPGRIDHEQKFHDEKRGEVAGDNHGVCIVDICDSTEIDLKIINSAVASMRSCIQQAYRDNILLAKNIGDGHLLVYKTPAVAFTIAQQLLAWQKSEKNKPESIHPSMESCLRGKL